MPSHSLMGEERGGKRRGGDQATFFPKEGGFFGGAWVKILQSDYVPAHEKSASHMPLTPHSPKPMHCYPNLSLVWYETSSACLKRKVMESSVMKMHNSRSL